MSSTFWVVAGLLLLVGEILVPAFVLCWFAVAALVVAAAVVLGLSSLTAQLVVFAAAAAPLTLASRTVFKKYLMAASPGRLVRTNVHALPGAAGVVVEAIEPHHGGRVLVHGMDWKARCASDGALAAGTRVHVIRVEGVTLVVEPEQAGGGLP